MLSRREFAASLLAMPFAMSGRAHAAKLPTRRVVDVHHHFISPGYAAAKRDVLMSMVGGNPAALEWSADRSIQDMDKAGISRSILSLVTPGIWFGDAVEARKLARDANAFAAGIVAQYPNRFGFFAAIPLPDKEGSLAEIAYALDTLHADGVLLMSNYDGGYLGDPLFDDVLSELNARNIVTYVHPRTPRGNANLVPNVPDVLLELIFDTTRTVTSLLFAGTAARTHGIKWIFSHGGGALPMIAARISGYAEKRPNFAAHFPDGLMAEIRRFYFDTANVAQSQAFAGLQAMVPNSQILFGTDAPGLSGSEQLLQLRRSSLGPADLQAIEHINADRLMPQRT